MAQQMGLAGDSRIDGHPVALIDALQDVADGFAHRFRRDVMGGVLGLLLLPPAVGLGQRRLQ